jgi:1-acyl-sn-glycerol-3-phosphate acyltransferase
MKTLFRLAYGLFAALVWLVVMFLIFCPLIIAMPTLSMRRAVGRAGVKISMAAIGQPLRVRGLENLPAGPCVVVANHASYLDGLVLTAALPSRFNFVVQEGAAKWPYVGLVIKRMAVIFISRSSVREGALQTRDLIRRLQRGESLAVFPEGTFRKEPGLMNFRNGAFLIAAHAHVPVVPAAIRGTRKLFGDEQKLPVFSPVTVEIGRPLAPKGGTDREMVVALRNEARAAVLAICGEGDGIAAKGSASAA